MPLASKYTASVAYIIFPSQLLSMPSSTSVAFVLMAASIN